MEVYKKHMGGVDLMDAMLARYRNDVRNKRGCSRIFYYLLNVTVVNAWILWRLDKVRKEHIVNLKFRSGVG